MKTTVTLTPKDIQTLVECQLLKTFKNIGEVKFEIGKKLTGGQMDEYYVEVFKGATVEVEIEMEE